MKWEECFDLALYNPYARRAEVCYCHKIMQNHEGLKQQRVAKKKGKLKCL